MWIIKMLNCNSCWALSSSELQLTTISTVQSHEHARQCMHLSCSGERCCLCSFRLSWFEIIYIMVCTRRGTVRIFCLVSTVSKRRFLLMTRMFTPPPPSQREREACFSLAPPWQRPRSQTFDCSFLCCSQIFGPIEHVALGHPTCKILLVGVVNNIVSVSWVQDSRVEWKRKKYWGKGQMERTDKNLEESRSR